MLAVRTTGLTKRFGKFTAVEDITLSVEQGEIFGFLGPNGAGKSTTIRMLCGILLPTTGQAVVAGFDVITQAEAVKQRIGYMSQKFSLYDDLTVAENIEFYAGIYQIVRADLDRVTQRVLKLTDLLGKDKVLTAELSRGLKQRLALGCAIVHQPPVVFLDEPTSGVDPIVRRQFWELIGELATQGTTVFVTTHFMDEAEHCNRIAFIAGGRLVSLGTPTELKERTASNNLEEAFVRLTRNGGEAKT